jgi:hypothetical protein
MSRKSEDEDKHDIRMRDACQDYLDVCNPQSCVCPRMATFVLTIGSGESHSLEVSTMMGAEELVDVFLRVLDGSQE